MSAKTIRPGLLRGAVEAPPSKSCHHRLLIAEWLALPRSPMTRSPVKGQRRRLGAPLEEVREEAREDAQKVAREEAQKVAREEAQKVAREEARESADIAATRRCLDALAKDGSAHLDVGESGSTLRFLLPLATLAVPEAVFHAEGRLPQRPIQPFLDLLSEHGLEFPNGAAFPLHVRGALRPGVFHVPGNISSQIITGLLFALPGLDGASEIRLTSPLESRGYIDLTLDVLAQYGICVEALPDDAGWRVPGGQRWRAPAYSGRETAAELKKETLRTPRTPRTPREISAAPEPPRTPREDSGADEPSALRHSPPTPRGDSGADEPSALRHSPRTPRVEGDWSGAAFWLVAGALGSDVAVSGLRPDSAQPDRAVAAILRRMGAEVRADIGADGLATMRAVAPEGGLRACEIDVSQCPDLLPALAVAAARAHGATRFVRAARLRLKESDRIAAMEAVLARFGVATESTPDTLTVHGVPDAPLRGGAEIPVAGDHRIAMAAAVAATVADAPVVLPGAECVSKSYPAFFDIFHQIQPAP